MTDFLMTTKELVAYISVNEKKIYSLVKAGAIPFTKVTGKYLFTKAAVDRWIEDSVISASTGRGSGRIMMTGSHDPAVELLVSEVNARFEDLTLLTASVGSTRGIEMLRNGGTDMAGIHILDTETSDYNLPWIEKNTPGLNPVVVHFALRHQGLIVPSGNPLGIKNIRDLAEKGLRFVGRQKGSGTRLLFDHLAAKEGFGIKAGDREKSGGPDSVYDLLTAGGMDTSPGLVSTHTEVAQAVRSGRADAGMGVRAAAAAAGLDFIHLADESFDIAVSRRTFYGEPVQKILEVARSEDFRLKVESMGGYNMKNSGSVISWG